MRFIAGGRGIGKTSFLIEEASKNHGIIVVDCKRREEQILKQAMEMGVDPIPKVVVARLTPFMTSMHERTRQDIYVDNFEIYCRSILEDVKDATIDIDYSRLLRTMLEEGEENEKILLSRFNR